MKFSLGCLYNDVKPCINNSEDVILCVFEMRSEWVFGKGKRTRTEAAAPVPVVGIKKSPKRQKKQCTPYVLPSAVRPLSTTLRITRRITLTSYSVHDTDEDSIVSNKIRECNS
jgi:hypothetical protein